MKEKLQEAMEKIQLLIDIGFDYDGCDTSVESMRELVDELVGFAKDAKVSLRELKNDFDRIFED